jgi:prophage regulatory protein
MQTPRGPKRQPTHHGTVLREDVLPALRMTQPKFDRRLRVSPLPVTKLGRVISLCNLRFQRKDALAVYPDPRETLAMADEPVAVKTDRGSATNEPIAKRKAPDLFVAHQLPETGYLRLPQIIGDRRADPPIPAIIPVSKSTWWQGVASGRYPKPVRTLGTRITAWKVEDIRALIERTA